MKSRAEPGNLVPSHIHLEMKYFRTGVDYVQRTVRSGGKDISLSWVQEAESEPDIGV